MTGEKTTVRWARERAELAEKIRPLRAKSMTLLAISIELNVEQSRVARICKQYNIPLGAPEENSDVH